MRSRRNMLSLSQKKLGEAIGLTFQQVQKYESGADRIAASRLHELSRVLDVPISFFFDTAPVLAPAMGGVGELPVTSLPKPVCDQETMELTRAYFSIKDTNIRQRLLDLAKTLAADAER